jgi:transcriptional regulator with XRE-family HTH domain
MEEKIEKRIGERIKEKREKTDMSQKDLGAAAGVTQSAVNQYEKGGKKPSSEVLSKIAMALGTSTDYLLGSAEEDAIFMDKQVAVAFRDFKELNRQDRQQILKNIQFLKDLSKKKEE